MITAIIVIFVLILMSGKVFYSVLIAEVSDDMKKSMFLIGDYNFKLGEDCFPNGYGSDYITKC